VAALDGSGFFIKLVMDETQKQANPKDASAIINELLKAP
jgi:hypothetical protein